MASVEWYGQTIPTCRLGPDGFLPLVIWLILGNFLWITLESVSELMPPCLHDSLLGPVGSVRWLPYACYIGWRILLPLGQAVLAHMLSMLATIGASHRYCTGVWCLFLDISASASQAISEICTSFIPLIHG